MIFQKRLHLFKKNSTDFYKFRLQVQNLQNICLPFLLIKLRNLKLWIFPREDTGWHLRLTLKLKYFHSLSFLLLSCIDLFECYLCITRKTQFPNLVRMNTFSWGGGGISRRTCLTLDFQPDHDRILNLTISNAGYVFFLQRCHLLFPLESPMFK